MRMAGAVLALAGAALLVISLFFDWYGYEATDVTVLGAGARDLVFTADGFSGWAAFELADVVLLVCALTTMWLPGMTERGRGAVINVASVAGFQPIPVQSTYAATKAFVLSFTEGVSSELRGTGVTITALCPGPVATEFVEAGGFKNESPGPSFIWSTAADVAKAGIEGAEKGKRVVIPGIANRMSASFGRHGPRSILLGPFAGAYRRTIGE